MCNKDRKTVQRSNQYFSRIKPESLGLPSDEYDGVSIIKRGFVYEFLKVALVKPVIAVKEPEKLKEW